MLMLMMRIVLPTVCCRFEAEVQTLSTRFCQDFEVNVQATAVSVACEFLRIYTGERCLLAKVLHWWIEALNHCKIDLTHFSETIEWFCKKSKSSESNV